MAGLNWFGFGHFRLEESWRSVWMGTHVFVQKHAAPIPNS